uniref:Uncharacterized protein n=1 Tax=Siphoviridae sp. ctJ0s2 TaxID=2827834 RepID=A0A8S5TEH8_9CAUD|nr:MAG TPA: hypothetical protein [Siphoviridae sp. ctJ0s2]
MEAGDDTEDEGRRDKRQQTEQEALQKWRACDELPSASEHHLVAAACHIFGALGELGSKARTFELCGSFEARAHPARQDDRRRDARSPKLFAESQGQRSDVGLRCEVSGLPWPRDERGNRRDIEDAPTSSRDEARQEELRQSRQRSNVYSQQVSVVLEGALGKAPLSAQPRIIDKVVDWETKALHVGEERGGCIGLSEVLREDVDGDVMGLLQLRLESEQAHLTASDKDKVAPQGGMQAGISFSEPTGSPRDEGGLSVIHTMVKRGFCAPQSSLLFALKMGRPAREINQLLYKAL